MTQHIYDWMLQNITDNGFSAKNIYAGLHLHEFDRKTQEELCLLYRRWRGTKEDKKSITAKQAYDLTLAGIDPSDVEPRQTEIIFTAHVSKDVKKETLEALGEMLALTSKQIEKHQRKED